MIADLTRFEANHYRTKVHPLFVILLNPPGSLLKRLEEPEPGKVEQGRVTSAVLSPAFGPIGLGYAFREVAIGDRLVSAAQPFLTAVVASLPFVP